MVTHCHPTKCTPSSRVSIMTCRCVTCESEEGSEHEEQRQKGAGRAWPSEATAWGWIAACAWAILLRTSMSPSTTPSPQVLLRSCVHWLHGRPMTVTFCKVSMAD